MHTQAPHQCMQQPSTDPGLTLLPDLSHLGPTLANHHPASALNSETKQWLAEHYFRFLSTEIQGAITYLNQSITWAIGVVTATAAFILGQFSTHTSPISSITLAVAILGTVILTHFLIRGIRGYLNVMRYTTLTKNLTAARLAFNDRSQSWDNSHLTHLLSEIQEYHLEWKSPLPRSDVLKKFFLEFGFGILYAIMVLHIGYYFYVAPPRSIDALILNGGIFLMSLEIYIGLFRSSYWKSIGDFALHP